MSWVTDEFHHPASVVVGAYEKEKIVGTCSLVPLNYILEKISGSEHELVNKALREAGVDLPKAIYIGGLSVDKEHEARGTSEQLFALARGSAVDKGYEVLVGYSARSSEKYSKLKALPIILRKSGMKELPLSSKIFYPSPNDLEKVWVYMFLNK